MSMKAGIVGGAGYAGVELARRLLEHPDFDLHVITSDSDADTPLAHIYPAFAGKTDIAFSKHETGKLRECDAVFLAVPHTAAMAAVPGLLDAGVSCFDLSADYRLKDQATYEKWYAPHTSPELLERAAFGLPEVTRAELDRAAAQRAEGTPALVACAGCYPTATSLASYPAISQGIVEGVVQVQAISGVTGAGRKANERTHFCSADENLEAYSAGTHRHTPEIEQILGIPGRVVFIPHLAPLGRGLLSTVTMQLTAEAAEGFDLEQMVKHYEDFYASSPFVQVCAAGTLPRTKSVIGSNNAHVGLAFSAETNTLIGVGAIDNLCKGAAAQAVQCANIVFGLREDAGLDHMASPV